MNKPISNPIFLISSPHTSHSQSSPTSNTQPPPKAIKNKQLPNKTKMCILHIYHYNCTCDLTGESLEGCPKKSPPTYGPYTAPSTQACRQSETIIHKLEEECPHCVWALQERDDEPAPAVLEKQAAKVERMMGQLRIREEGGQEVGDRELQARDERGQREREWVMGMSVWGDEEIVGKWGSWVLNKEG